MPAFDNETIKAISAALASYTAEKAFEPIMDCIINGGDPQECIRETGQEPIYLIPRIDPVPFIKGSIEILTQHRIHLQNQIKAIDDVLHRFR